LSRGCSILSPLRGTSDRRKYDFGTEQLRPGYAPGRHRKINLEQSYPSNTYLPSSLGTVGL
ncbi:hypothetical protein, partial [Bacteroides cellulosilyticus]|uniref:hypothetical protein n=1 Tax=Bacteroides cellulosilyticus TaxID=246787 RepID=UPI0034A3F350